MKLYTDVFGKLHEGLTPELSKSIQEFMDSNTYFDLYDPDDENLMYNTRDHGSVGDEQAGKKDIDEAERLKRELLQKFDGIEVDIEVVDEWVHLNISNSKSDVAEYRYIFKKDSDGQGFSASFDNMDDLIERYGDWVDVDWNRIKEQVEQIDDFPHNTFTDWYNSRQLKISSKGDTGNEWGYNFYIIKSRKMVRR